eukprot:RCo005906
MAWVAGPAVLCGSGGPSCSPSHSGCADDALSPTAGNASHRPAVGVACPASFPWALCCGAVAIPARLRVAGGGPAGAPTGTGAASGGALPTPFLTHPGPGAVPASRASPRAVFLAELEDKPSPASGAAYGPAPGALHVGVPGPQDLRHHRGRPAARPGAPDRGLPHPRNGAQPTRVLGAGSGAPAALGRLRTGVQRAGQPRCGDRGYGAGRRAGPGPATDSAAAGLRCLGADPWGGSCAHPGVGLRVLESRGARVGGGGGPSRACNRGLLRGAAARPAVVFVHPSRQVQRCAQRAHPRGADRASKLGPAAHTHRPSARPALPPRC